MTDAWRNEESPHVSVIVPTFRRPDALRHTLNALTCQRYPKDRYEIFVVDDGPEETTQRLVAAFADGPPKIRYLSQPHSGAARARNLGAQAATGDLLLFVDDDILLPPDAIARFIAAIRALGPCCLNGRWEFPVAMLKELSATPFGRFRLALESWVRSGMRLRPIDERHAEVELLTACNLMLPTEDFWKIGGFDETIPFAGYEDQEFSLRARDRGYRLIYDGSLQCLHNDHRMSRQEFLERQRRGALTAALLWSKRPDHFEGRRALIRENDGLRLADPWRLTLKKLLKLVLSSRPALVAFDVLAGVIERWWPSAPLLTSLYWVMCGLYIFRGVREGLAAVRR